jgi:6,7-dimethyl-8-ribityllumazine synthase
MKKSRRITIIVSRFNEKITRRLEKYCRQELERGGVKNITTVWVPGAYELPFVAQRAALAKKSDAIIALGCVIKGETSHDKHIASWVATGLGEISLKYNVPVLFGVLTPNNEDQALERSSSGPLNRGVEVGRAAVELLNTLDKMES